MSMSTLKEKMLEYNLLQQLMATKIRNYKNGKIYTIWSHQTNKVYYGSTTQLLSKLIAKHRNGYKVYKNNKCRYITAFEIVNFFHN
jgi:hypothetical protein